MEKLDLIKELTNFKKQIQEFHKKRWHYTTNIHPDLVEEKIKNNKTYENHDLNNNLKLKNAVFGVEYSKLSKERKEEVYYVDKSNLKQVYGKLKKFIVLFGENPGIDNKSCYDGYFLNDGYQFEEANFSSIISDIDIIIGKLNSFSEQDYKKQFQGKKEQNLWKLLNPVYWVYKILVLSWKHRWISVPIIFIIGLIATEVFTPIVDIITRPIQEFLSGALLKK